MARVSSPCNSVCEISIETGWCRGCLRTLDEIAQWGAYTEEERLGVLQQIEIRQARKAEKPNQSPSPSLKS